MLRSHFLVSLFLSGILILIPSFIFSAEDSITITTYYPSPVGVYGKLRLYPRQARPSDPQLGDMYYDDGTNTGGSYAPGLYVYSNRVNDASAITAVGWRPTAGTFIVQGSGGWGPVPVCPAGTNQVGSYRGGFSLGIHLPAGVPFANVTKCDTYCSQDCVNLYGAACPLCRSCQFEGVDTVWCKIQPQWAFANAAAATPKCFIEYTDTDGSTHREAQEGWGTVEKVLCSPVY